MELKGSPTRLNSGIYAAFSTGSVIWIRTGAYSVRSIGRVLWNHHLETRDAVGWCGDDDVDI